MAALRKKNEGLIRVAPLLIGILMPLCVVGCRSDEEWQIRRAVKRIVAGEYDHKRAMRFAVEKGRYALPEIEQQMHAAEPEARLRLIAVIRKIADPESIHLLGILARWGEDDKVKAAAKEAAAALSAKR